MTTIYLVMIFFILSIFIIVPFFMAYNDKDKIHIIQYPSSNLNLINLVEKLGKLVKRSDEINILSGKKIKIPIDYTLNNNILLLSDKEEDLLIEDLANHIRTKGLLYRPDIEVKVKFSNKRNHPYNFMEIWMESK